MTTFGLCIEFVFRPPKICINVKQVQVGFGYDLDNLFGRQGKVFNNGIRPTYIITCVFHISLPNLGHSKFWIFKGWKKSWQLVNPISRRGFGVNWNWIYWWVIVEECVITFIISQPNLTGNWFFEITSLQSILGMHFQIAQFV